MKWIVYGAVLVEIILVAVSCISVERTKESFFVNFFRSVKPSDGDTIREMIKAENEMINQRLGWLLAAEGLLFSALAFAWKQLTSDLVLLIALLGISLSLAVFPVMFTAHKAICDMCKWWKDSCGLGYRTIPDVIGFRMKDGGCDIFRRLMLPWFSMPLIFAAAWLCVVYLLPDSMAAASETEAPNHTIYVQQGHVYIDGQDGDGYRQETGE